MATDITLQMLAKMIDHSLLHPTLTDAGVIAGCKLAKLYDVATACVKPYSAAAAAAILRDSEVGVCSVIGFPHGNSKTSIKIAETEDAIQDGATEIDMVVNIGKVLGGNWKEVSREIQSINECTISGGAILKVIFENDYLGDEEIIQLCRVCSDYAVAFVKTSTGYGFMRQPNGMYSYAGATDHHLALMRQHCSPQVQIKAAGGVRSLDDLLRVRAFGVTRIGATATASILDEARQRGYA